MQRAPDGHIYVAVYQAYYLAAITAPNATGAGCNFVPNAVALTNQSLYGLPNFPNQPPAPLRLLVAPSACVGQVLTFRADGVPVVGQVPRWDFGDPAAGAANQATGTPVQHTYPRPGTYLVTLTVASATGPQQRTQTVRVYLLATRPAPADGPRHHALRR